MTIRRFTAAAAIALLWACPGCRAAMPARASENFQSADAGWSRLPEILKRIVPPRFAARGFNITRFGAVGDGRTDCTLAFSNAIAACHDSGGGRVIVPAGRFYTGAIHLRSNVNLHLARGAELIFSDRFSDYLPPVRVRVGGIELYNYSPLIYARNCRNIAITGPGRLDGNAAAWWQWKNLQTTKFFDEAARGVPVKDRVFGTPQSAIRPSFVSFVSCTNVLLEDFTIGSGPNWTIQPIYCLNTTVRGVTVDTHGPNNDGLDPDSCRDMLVENCTFNTGDDCMALKSGYNEDGWRVGRPTEDIVVRRCVFQRGHGGLSIGSEMSGGVRNVFMEDCKFDGTDRVVRIKSRRGRGGAVENIFARNLVATNIQREVVVMNMDYSSDRHQAANEKAPRFNNIWIENLQAAGAQAAIRIQGLPDSRVQNVCFRNLQIRSASGVVCRNANGAAFDDVVLTPAKGPVFELADAARVTIQHSPAPAGSGVFLKVDGERCGQIVVENCDLSGAKQRLLAAPGLAANAVEFANDRLPRD